MTKKAKLPSGWPILGRYIVDHPWAYVVAVLSIALSSVLAAIIPKLVGHLADTYNAGHLSLWAAERTALWILLVGSVRVTTGWLGRFLTAQHGRKITFSIREQLFSKWETLTPAYYHQHSTGELLSHALSDVDVVRQMAAMGINTAINGVFMLGASAYFMYFTMDSRLAVASLIPLLGIPALIHHFGPKIKRQSALFQASVGAMSQTVEEIVGGIRTVKALSNEPVMQQRFEKQISALVEQKLHFTRLSAFFGASIPLLSAVGFIIVIWYGSSLVIQHQLSLGALVSFLLYLTLLKQPLEQLGNMLNTVQRASASLSRIADLLAVVPDTVDQHQAIEVPDMQGAIEVRNLTFRYPGARIDSLRNVSFRLAPGQTLGVVGSIGSGKTTLGHLLLRLYEPPAGTIFIDGRDILTFPLEQLRRSIAYVPQNSFLFSTTVSANIAFAEELAPHEQRVRHAAKVAAIDQDIQKFPEGYETEIGERGVRLSGGQKQRLAIARMIYKEAPIRVLDDSLSAVDTKTERCILDNLAQDRHASALVISHRLSAVMNADEILILDASRVAERGNHESLLEQGGIYSRLWALQTGEVDRSDSLESEPYLNTELLEIIRVEDQSAVKEELEEQEV
jgi:ATP-binding cassette subfamily B protein